MFVSLRSSDGMGLISVVIASGVLSAVAYSMSGVMSQNMRAQRHSELLGDLESDRLKIRQGLACDTTGAQCAGASGFVNLLSRDGSILINLGTGANGTKIGQWNLRARCTAPGAFTVERTRFAAIGGGFAKDPLTDKPEGWSSLFPASSPSPCLAASSAGAWVRCPNANQVLAGIRADGTPICRNLPEGAANQIFLGLNASGAPVYKTPVVQLSSCQWVNNGPYDHCGCPAGTVQTGFNADVPIPAGMLFQASCQCCTIGVTLQ